MSDYAFGKETAAGLERTKLEQVVVLRDVAATTVPAGDAVEIESDTEVTILQSADVGYTVQVPTMGLVCLVNATDADALGKRLAERDGAEAAAGAAASSGDTERQINAHLRCVYDPELPVNIVDLGLVYETRIEEDGSSIVVEMTLTTQTCGMGNVIGDDIKSRLKKIQGVDEVDVRIVWDPPWSPTKISPEGRKKLGIG